jgi:hypothetical protein
VIRRIELYAVAPDAPAVSVDSLANACRRAGEFIPQVVHSHVGWNRSDAPVQLVWEHAFASPEAYQRYMIHPYHSNVLDRYLLHDAPERVVTDNDLAAGLVGYSCDGPVFVTTGGVRRLVLLRLDGGATPAAVDRVCRILGGARAAVDQMALSVIGANTLGSAWFDGITRITGRPRFSHVWEQGFATVEDLDVYRRGPTPLARAERANFNGFLDGVVTDAVSLHYEIDGPRP